MFTFWILPLRNVVEDCFKCRKYKDLYTEQLLINTELAKRLNEYNSLHSLMIQKLKDL